MAIRLVVLEESEALHGLVEQWQSLVDQVDTGALFCGPRWLLAWWRAYQRQLGAELYSLAAFEDDRLVGLAPFYKRQAGRAATRNIKEIRLLGDAGPRPPALDIMAEPGYEEAVGNRFAEHLTEVVADWDVIDLQPMRDPSGARAFMASRLHANGRPMDCSETGGAQRIELLAVGVQSTKSDVDERASVYARDAAQLRKGLATLRRISRLEWADRDEASPFADRQATHLFEDFALALGKEGRARLARFDDQDGEAVAAALVVDDSGQAIVIAMAVDPEHHHGSRRLLAAEAHAAQERGCLSLNICAGGGQYELPNMPATKQRAIRLRIYGTSSTATVARTYSKVRQRVERVTEAPGAAAAGARAAWSKIRTAASTVAGLDRMHLYRGELWTRGIEHTEGLSLEMFAESDYDALSSSEQEQLLECVDASEQGLRDTWGRGDIAVLASLHNRPAGIAWCASKRVFVPEIDHYLEIGSGEAYIHNLFVAPQARGRSVAPSMLEFLAQHLRQNDVYRSWALIGSDNIASVRAFEKAAYAAVADVIRAHVSAVEKLVVRPPDPEARKLLGL